MCTRLPADTVNQTLKVFMEEDNFDDNGFAWFDSFQKAKPGSAIYDHGMARVVSASSLHP
jgi:phospholipase C